MLDKPLEDHTRAALAQRLIDGGTSAIVRVAFDRHAGDLGMRDESRPNLVEDRKRFRLDSFASVCEAHVVEKYEVISLDTC